MPAELTARLGTTEVTLHRLSGRAYFRAAALLAKVLGPALAGLVSGAGIRAELPDGTEVSISWGEIVSLKGESGFRLLGALLGRLGNIDPDDLLALAEAMLVDHAWINGAPINRAETLDAVLPDGPALIGLVGLALRHNFLPTSADAPTPEGSSADETQQRPAGTSPRRARSR
jgi:hypothetical protein